MLSGLVGTARKIESARNAQIEAQAVAAIRECRATNQDIVTFLQAKLRGSRSAQRRHEYQQKIDLVSRGYVWRYELDDDDFTLEISNTIPPDNEYAQSVRDWAREYAVWFFETRTPEEQQSYLTEYAQDSQTFLEEMLWAMIDADPEREPWEMVVRTEEFGHYLDGREHVVS